MAELLDGSPVRGIIRNDVRPGISNSPTAKQCILKARVCYSQERRRTKRMGLGPIPGKGVGVKSVGVASPVCSKLVAEPLPG